MSDHDPLCPVAMFGDRHPKTSAWCHCALIARVRADERERIVRLRMSHWLDGGTCVCLLCAINQQHRGRSRELAPRW